MNNREKFEKWFESRYDAHFMQFALYLDFYVDKHTQTCWEAWQAATKQALEVAYDQTHLNGSAMDVYNILKGGNNG